MAPRTKRRPSWRSTQRSCRTSVLSIRRIAGQRAVGPGVIDAFYAGLDTVDLDQFDYLCKLDLDLDLPPRYFERLMVRMESDRRIGTTSGKPGSGARGAARWSRNCAATRCRWA